MLSQQLAKGWEYLARHLVLLPSPYPGCILFFTVAADHEPASIFHVRGTTLESAWREGATRVRQWAWARQRDAVQLRIDWVQDITPLPPGSSLPDTAQAGPLAVADAGLERAELLHGRGFAASPSPAQQPPCVGGGAGPHAPACLLLHLRGIYLSATEPPQPVPRPLPAQARPGRCGPMHELPLRAALALLLDQQRGDGSWPGAEDACDHLGLTYALLLGQRHAGKAPLAKAIDRAIGRAIDHLARRLARPAAGRLAAALALLVLARYAADACTPAGAARHRLRSAALQQMDRLAEALLRAPGPGTPQPLDMAWASLAMQAYADSRLHTQAPPVLRAAQGGQDGRDVQDGPGSLSPAFIQAALSARQDQDNAGAGARWIGIALAESIQRAPQPRMLAEQAPPPWRSRLQCLLQALHSRAVWPEEALYLPPPQRRLAAFLRAESRQILQDPAETARLLVHGLAALQLRDCLAQALHAGAPRPQPAHPPPGAGHGPAHSPQPMRWPAATMAEAMQGRWMNLLACRPPPDCLGVDASRPHHLAGGAMLVRGAGMAYGVPGAALQSVRAGALISSSPHGLFKYGLPVLHVPDLPAGLANLARAARQRVKAPVVAVTGCAGKTSTLGMLRRCLQQGEDARADALLSQGTALQMVNWSDTAACALLELPLQTLCEDLALAMPDVLVFTNITFENTPHTGNSLKDKTYRDPERTVLTEVVSAMQRMHKGSCLVVPQEIGSQPVLRQAASSHGIRLITFGPAAGAVVREMAFHEGGLQIQCSRQRLSIALQSDGHHMALNAQAALGALLALGLPLHSAACRLAGWVPRPGAGQPQWLPSGICLLDHSMSNHLLSVKAAFSQLCMHARQGGRRLVVLAGIESPQASLDTAQLALEPLVRSAPARRVLLYGEPLRQLAMALGDLLHVNWYDDLNQLICSLLRTLEQGDTVLLAGRACTNLVIAADAIRDFHGERGWNAIGPRAVHPHSFHQIKMNKHS